MPFHSSITRRQWLKNSALLAAISAMPNLPFWQDRQRRSRPADHYAVGKNNLVTSTSRQASESALWAISKGGNAADAYLTAALTQTVVEHGLTSLGGGFSIKYFDAASGEITSILGPLGPAAAEPYDFERESPVTQTGRAMPVPGFLSGVHAAHKRFGKLKWETLFLPAVNHAANGFEVGPTLVTAASSKATRFEEGKSLWMKQGRLLRPVKRLSSSNSAIRCSVWRRKDQIIFTTVNLPRITFAAPRRTADELR